jgi:hypothetical protein
MNVEFIRDVWWLMFPIFGMAMACWSMAQEERRLDRRLESIRPQLEDQP